MGGNGMNVDAGSGVVVGGMKIGAGVTIAKTVSVNVGRGVNVALGGEGLGVTGETSVGVG
ncbi:MAG: hypothetical protein C0184_05410 [Chloroflexus aggregans]|uniref:Uncharacterized protein n=1 Tax=Chloroflexus aggregans TaxID=152260 RepID=A0A2J6X889_9CHLR|nr:MAG: hypothetical protein C0184_05410 [Chloroflexus aggregans]